MEEDCSLTLKEIRVKLQQEYQLTTSLKTADRAIKSFSWLHKNVSLTPARRNDHATIHKLLLYTNEVFPILTENNGEDVFNVIMRSKKEDHQST